MPLFKVMNADEDRMLGIYPAMSREEALRDAVDDYSAREGDHIVAEEGETVSDTTIWADGTVRYWSVYTQTWAVQSATNISAKELSALSDEERDAIVDAGIMGPDDDDY